MISVTPQHAQELDPSARRIWAAIWICTGIVVGYSLVAIIAQVNG